jgi:hypothetical protein
VTSNPAGIDCGGTCSASFPGGTQVTLTATPNTDEQFLWWSGACSGTEAMCVLSINGNASVTATFGLR